LIPDCLAENLLGQAIGIGICCVKEIETGFITMIKHGKSFFFGDRPLEAAVRVSKAHASHTNWSDTKTADSELHVSHVGFFQIIEGEEFMIARLRSSIVEYL
jgi:hypothetical protein